ncbi:MAG TPA: DinB family protein [Ktedonobacteraceae bacterium]|nr:DinB family protein [Ktedonobacteraceae bacterium]
MDIIEFFRHEQKRLHTWMREAVSDLTVEEWNTVPAGNGNSIAFLFWHAVRTEDNILRFILQGRKPLWIEGNWHERLHLPPIVQGTGMGAEEAQALRINDPELFLVYSEEVWREYETYLVGITDGGAELSARIVKVKPLGEMPAILTIGQVSITHLFTHYGEISLIRGQFNKQGTPI